MVMERLVSTFIQEIIIYERFLGNLGIFIYLGLINLESCKIYSLAMLMIAF